ncbi:MAG TPA: hypothetical protein VF042_07510 [Gemmatimonadaceae bacterium]
MTTETPAGGTPLVPARGPSVRTALVLAVLGAVGATIATMVVLRNEYGVWTEVVIGVAALVFFGLAAYGLIQAVLAIIDTAGERRRHERTVTERRKGDRARPPRQ